MNPGGLAPGSAEDHCAAFVNGAGLRLLSLERPARGWLLAGVQELGFQEGSHHSVIGVAHCAYIVQIIRLILNILHSSESLTILVCATQRVSR